MNTIQTEFNKPIYKDEIDFLSKITLTLIEAWIGLIHDYFNQSEFNRVAKTLLNKPFKILRDKEIVPKELKGYHFIITIINFNEQNQNVLLQIEYYKNDILFNTSTTQVNKKNIFN